MRGRVVTVADSGVVVGSTMLGLAPGAQAATLALPAAAAPLEQAPTAVVPEAMTSVLALTPRMQGSNSGGLLPTREHVRFIEQVAISRARNAIGARHAWSHMCLGFVRSRFGLPGRQRTALRAWLASNHKHRWDRHPPAGVPVFWTAGRHRAGHVAISLGHGMIVSTDMPRRGHINRIRLSTIQRRWGLRYLGWTEDLEGVRIYRR